MEIQYNISLKGLNTFGIEVNAGQFAEVTSVTDVAALGTFQNKRVLGGGSNILCVDELNGLTILNKIKGIEIEHEDENHVWIKVASGEVWHDFVMHTIDQNLNGIENLALIPGTTGASPIQNIGAYGVEVKDTIESVTFWNFETEELQTFSKAECHFGYRDSIFKNELKGKFFITSVLFKLSRLPNPNVGYGAIKEELEKMKIENPTGKDIAQAVIHIRSSKLPDPKVIGNAGSFFKNPTISVQQYLDLKKDFPLMPSYPVNEQVVKVPAAWLIEYCGWKGYRKNDVGVHAKQALVLVNYAMGNGKEIWDLSSEIVASVSDRFGIELEREVQVWP